MNLSQTNSRLLIVDDEQLLLELMLEELSEAGYAVKGAHSTTSAMKHLAENSFDCIVLDLNLAGSSGKEVVDFIKNNPKDSNYKTPIIIASGVLEGDSLNELSSMVQDNIAKPFTNGSLIEKIEQCILNSPNKKRAA